MSRSVPIGPFAKARAKHATSAIRINPYSNGLTRKLMNCPLTRPTRDHPQAGAALFGRAQDFRPKAKAMYPPRRWASAPTEASMGNVDALGRDHAAPRRQF